MTAAHPDHVLSEFDLLLRKVTAEWAEAMAQAWRADLE